MISGSFKRARNSRTVVLVSRAVEAAASVAMPGRRTASLVPRSVHQQGSPTMGGPNALSSSGGATTSPQKTGNRARAVPVSTTMVQDGVKWVNLVRFMNLARLLTPVLRPRSRRRVRFGATPSQRAMLMTSKGCAVKAISAPAALGAEGGQGQPVKSRPIYIQVRQGRQLVWPTFEGVDHSCFCLLLADNQPRGSTQAVPVDSSSNTNSVQWNEVFSFPRSCLEARASGIVRLQVWSSETFGDDVLVGQADLDLGPMMAAERPHPLTTVLELQAIDDETGQVEPGTCGELVVAAWMEPEVDAAKRTPACGVAAVATADLHEAGVLTSNLSAPCGSKSMPQVVHSPLGTLYEEPCVVVLKLSVVGLVELDFDLVASSAQQYGITRKRVRLEGVQRSSSNAIIGAARPSRKDTGILTMSSGTPGVLVGLAAPPPLTPASGLTPPPSAVPYASSSMARGMGAYVDRMNRLPPQQRSLMRQLQSPLGPGGGGPSVAEAARASITARVRRAVSEVTKYGGALRRGSGAAAAGGGAGGDANSGAGGTGDELIEEDDGLASTGGGVEDGRVTADDNDDGSSLAINPTAPLSGMGSEEPTAGVGQGSGIFCYFKVSVDKQSHKSRLRWLPAPAASLLANPLGEPVITANVPLQPSVFVFALARPLVNAPVGLSLYATGSAKRRGRVVGRTVVPLYELLDQLLNAADASTAGGLAQRRDMGVSGKAVEVTMPFDEEELGGVRLLVQLADLDERAMTFRLPLLLETQQPHALEGHHLPYTGASYFGPSVLPVDNMSSSGAVRGGAAGAAAGPGGPSVGPVLADTTLLQHVLDRSDVDTEISHWFFRSYQRVGSLKAAGLVGPQDDRAMTSLHKVFRAGLRRRGPVGLDGLSSALLDDPSLSWGSSLDPILPFHRDFLKASATGAATIATTASATVTAAPSLDGSNSGRNLGGGAAATVGGAPSVAGAPTALGSLVLRITSLNSSGAIGGTSCCCIVKCGPHWLRTVDRAPSEGVGSMPQWQVVIPLYSPATILTVGIFSNSVKSVMGLTFSDNPVLVSRVRLKLSSVRPFRKSWHVITMYMNGGTSSGSVGSTPPLVGILGVKLQYGSKSALAASYLAAPAPESLYELDLESDVALRMEADARKISENWLASAQPPIPPEVARLLLDDGRSTFNFPRIKTNWRRVKSGLQLLFRLNAWFKNICSWKSPRDSWEVVFCIALLCYMPSTAFKLFFILIALRGVKSLMRFKRRIAALAEGGADSAAALLMSPAAAPSAASGGLASAAVAAAGGAKEPVGTVGDVTIGGGVVEGGSDDEVGEDSKVPVGTVAEFKRKFAELVELGLLLQNLFDDVASILERMQAVLSFQDPVASILFILACGLLVVVLALLGFPTTFFLTLLWQVRPPSLRDPLPPPPLNYFLKLPCRSTAEFG